jgi:DNA-binding NtrC family response regulator
VIDFTREITRTKLTTPLFLSVRNSIQCFGCVVDVCSGSSGGSMTAEPDRRTVLVIDDDRVLADTLAQILRLNGFQPVALYSGEEAVELVERLQPDIVLSDIRMSSVDGIEAANRIRELHPECRVILFTAHPVSTAMRHMIRRMDFELLQRPLHPEEVLTTLRRAPQ